MYLCLCQGITKKQVQTILQTKVLTLEDIQRKYQIGKNCGSCLEQLEDIINESKHVPLKKDATQKQKNSSN